MKLPNMPRIGSIDPTNAAVASKPSRGTRRALRVAAAVLAASGTGAMVEGCSVVTTYTQSGGTNSVNDAYMVIANLNGKEYLSDCSVGGSNKGFGGGNVGEWAHETSAQAYLGGLAQNCISLAPKKIGSSNSIGSVFSTDPQGAWTKQSVTAAATESGNTKYKMISTSLTVAELSELSTASYGDSKSFAALWKKDGLDTPNMVKGSFIYPPADEHALDWRTLTTDINGEFLGAQIMASPNTFGLPDGPGGTGDPANIWFVAASTS
jgi:hypothetical protein